MVVHSDNMEIQEFVTVAKNAKQCGEERRIIWVDSKGIFPRLRILFYVLLACAVSGVVLLVTKKFERDREKVKSVLEARASLEQFLIGVEKSYQRDLVSKEATTEVIQDETTTALKVPAIIEVYPGYKCEVHHVHTNDGYILELHRVVNLLKSYNSSYPVILQHGLLSDSSNWVLNGGDKRSLAFALAQRGHDVWLANSRGNHYSKNHEEWDSNMTPGPFWNFTWYEMAKYDVPAVVDYVLDQSQKNKVHYCGHSQGTMIMLTALDIYSADLRDKIASFHAMAPIAFLGHMSSPLKYIANSMLTTPLIFKEWPEEILPRNKLGLWISDMLGKFIGNKGVPNMLTLIFGFHSKLYVQDKISTYLTHTPAGTSFQDILHFAQIIRSNSLQTFQIGRHGDSQPILLENIRNMSNIYFYVGADDEFSDYTDVDRLEEQLVTQGNQITRLNIDTYDHLCFIWGYDAYYHVYQHIVKTVEILVGPPCPEPLLPECQQS